jgi:hypothetical protein
MTGTINLGDNYSVEEDSNGDLVVTDSTGTPVFKHEDGADSISAVAPFDAIDADAGKLLSALDANSKDITDIATLGAAALQATALQDEVDTAQLNNDAVDTAQIASAAVVQGAIASGAVTVDELASALGTDSNNKIPGTTFFKDANVEALEADEVSTARTWQNVTSSRSINTSEQNNTNGEIKATVAIESNSDGTLIGANWDNDVSNSDIVDDVVDSGERVTLQTTIPAGASYKINQFSGTTDSSLASWLEFRP